MSSSTIALIKPILAVCVTILNASIQTYALLSLNKTTIENDDLSRAKKILLASVISQFVAALLLIAVAITVIVHRKKIGEYMSNFIYIGLVIGGLLMLTGGSLGAVAAFRMQCYRSDANVAIAWKWSSWTAVIGILSTMLMLVIQMFVKRKTIRETAIKHLTGEWVPYKTHVPVATAPIPVATAPIPVYTAKKATMPTYHPPTFKKAEEMI